MPGPPPTPLHLRLLKGNPGKRPIRPEPEPPRAEACPEPPPFVIGYAADEWHRIAPELYALKLLTVVDLMPLAAYVVAYARWRTAVESLARTADADPVTHALLIKSTDGSPRRNPLVQIARQGADDMVQYASMFGMTPVARSRIAAGVGGQPPATPSKFDGLLR